MCELCERKTYEQLFETMHRHIGAGRWALQGVEAGPNSSGWIYTVGLTHNFAHPELVIVKDDLRSAGALLNEIGAAVQRGIRLDASATLDLGGYLVEFEAVHESYLAGGLCASCDGYNAWAGAPVAPITALQVAPPLSQWCAHCDRQRRCLATPGAPGFGDRRNRAARRVRPRARRRSS